MSLISVSICLSDIPKHKIKQADNGKKYLNIIVANRKEISQYGETHTVFLSQDKDEREKKVDKIYIGGGKEFTETPKAVTAEEIEKMPPVQNEDDFPF